MNPNMLAVLTETVESTNVELMQLTVYILDGVTGKSISSAAVDFWWISDKKT